MFLFLSAYLLYMSSKLISILVKGVKEVLLVISSVLIDEISSMEAAYFSRPSQLPLSYLEAVVIEANKASVEQYGIDAGGYTFPRAMLYIDMKSFQASQVNLVVMLR